MSIVDFHPFARLTGYVSLLSLAADVTIREWSKRVPLVALLLFSPMGIAFSHLPRSPTRQDRAEKPMNVKAISNCTLARWEGAAEPAESDNLRDCVVLTVPGVHIALLRWSMEQAPPDSGEPEGEVPGNGFNTWGGAKENYRLQNPTASFSALPWTKFSRFRCPWSSRVILGRKAESTASAALRRNTEVMHHATVNGRRIGRGKRGCGYGALYSRYPRAYNTCGSQSDGAVWTPYRATCCQTCLDSSSLVGAAKLAPEIDHPPASPN